MQATRAALLALSLAACALAAELRSTAEARQTAMQEAWSRDLMSKESPVKRVVNLLRKMRAELEHEQATEAEMYDKMVCWCDTNEKEKTKAIADAETRTNELTAEIERRSAQVGELAATIANLKDQVAADTKALKEATAIREDAAADFREEEKDLIGSITNTKDAVVVMKRVHGSSLLQVDDKPAISGLKVLLRSLSEKYQLLQAGRRGATEEPRTALISLSEEVHRAASQEAQGLNRELLRALAGQGGSDEALPVKFAEKVVAQSARASRTVRPAFLQADVRAPGYQSYSPASSQIFGIMKTMLQDFDKELKTAQKEEATSVKDYEDLKKTKSEQISVGKEKLDDAEEQDSANSKALSDAKEDLEITREQRAADVKFLQNLKVTCGDLDKEFQRRRETRAAEIQAVMEAEGVLVTEEENRVTAARVATSLLQQGERAGEGATLALRRGRAVRALRAAARDDVFEADDLLEAWRSRGHGHRRGRAVGAIAGPRGQLSALAVAVQLDSFKKIKEMMDTMVVELKKQQKEEVEFKAHCNTEINDNEKDTLAKEGQQKDLETKLEKLDLLMKKTKKEIGKAKTEIAEAELAVKKASQAREAENAEFQQTVSDQRIMQSILRKALTKLEDFYKKGKGNKMVFLEREEGSQSPPVQLTKYKKNAGGNSVMSLIEQIIGDSKNLEAEATKDEYQAQADYVKFVQDSNALIKENSEAIVKLTALLADSKEESAEATGDLESAISELESLAAYGAKMHGECDWVLKNFNARQKARGQEIEAIQQAKGILSGAK